MTSKLLLESKLSDILILENKKSIVEASIDAINYNVDYDYLCELYEASNQLKYDLIIADIKYGNYTDDEIELLSEGLWDKFKSVAKGVGASAIAAVKGKGIEGAKAAYSDTALKTRSKYFKNRFGGILHNIKQVDPSLKIGDKFGGVDVKPYQSDIQKIAGTVAAKTGQAIGAAKEKAGQAVAAVKQVAGSIKDKAGQVLDAAWESAITTAIVKFVKAIWAITKKGTAVLKNPKEIPALITKFYNHLKPNLTISADKTALQNLMQVMKQNPGWTNFGVGLMISLSKWITVASGLGTAGISVAVGAAVGMVLRTAYGVYIKGEDPKTAAYKALKVTAASIAIGAMIKGLIAVFNQGTFWGGVKSYFVGGPPTTTGQQQQNLQGGNPSSQIVDLDGLKQSDVANLTKQLHATFSQDNPPSQEQLLKFFTDKGLDPKYAGPLAKNIYGATPSQSEQFRDLWRMGKGDVNIYNKIKNIGGGEMPKDQLDKLLGSTAGSAAQDVTSGAALGSLQKINAEQLRDLYIKAGGFSQLEDMLTKNPEYYNKILKPAIERMYPDNDADKVLNYFVRLISGKYKEDPSLFDTKKQAFEDFVKIINSAGGLPKNELIGNVTQTATDTATQAKADAVVGLSEKPLKELGKMALNGDNNAVKAYMEKFLTSGKTGESQYRILEKALKSGIIDKDQFFSGEAPLNLNLQAELRGYVPIKINGQSVIKFLTPTEAKSAYSAMDMAKAMGNPVDETAMAELQKIAGSVPVKENLYKKMISEMHNLV